MRTIAITARCRCCGRRVEDAMHLILCDCCLDARLARPEAAPARAVSPTAAGGFGAERLRALTLGPTLFSRERPLPSALGRAA
jgi:hypothetical protein